MKETKLIEKIRGTLDGNISKSQLNNSLTKFLKYAVFVCGQLIDYISMLLILILLVAIVAELFTSHSPLVLLCYTLSAYVTMRIHLHR